MTDFRGVVPPVITPMNPDGSLDLESLDRLVDHLIDGGMHGLFILGSCGQVAYLTDAERDAVVTRVVERVAGRVPVQVGTPDFTARRICESARRAQELGADAVVVSAPVYALNDEAEIERHLRIVADSVDIPVFAYDVPVRVHTKLGRDLLINLGKDGVLTGVKDSSGDDVAFRRLVAANGLAGHPLQLLTGHEVMVDGMLLLGADGAVPGSPTSTPQATADSGTPLRPATGPPPAPNRTASPSCSRSCSCPPVAPVTPAASEPSRPRRRASASSTPPPCLRRSRG